MLTKCITLKERSIWQHEPIIVLTINNHIIELKNFKKFKAHTNCLTQRLQE
jgi:hypothetical protein